MDFFRAIDFYQGVAMKKLTIITLMLLNAVSCNNKEPNLIPLVDDKNCLMKNVLKIEDFNRREQFKDLCALFYREKAYKASPPPSHKNTSYGLF